MSLGLEPVLTAHRTQAAKAHRQQENPGAHRTFQQFRRMRIPTTEMQFQYASVLNGNCIASFVYADMGYIHCPTNLGLHARWQGTVNRTITAGVRSADTTLIEAKIGYHF